MFLTPEMVPRACSKGFDMVSSTDSGDSPGYVVMTRTYGREIWGSRSSCILMILTTPSTIMMMTITSTVNGFFTLNFDTYFSFIITSHIICDALSKSASVT